LIEGPLGLTKALPSGEEGGEDGFVEGGEVVGFRFAEWGEVVDFRLAEWGEVVEFRLAEGADFFFESRLDCFFLIRGEAGAGDDRFGEALLLGAGDDRFGEASFSPMRSSSWAACRNPTAIFRREKKINGIL
jgi:hypothetical protein